MALQILRRQQLFGNIFTIGSQIIFFILLNATLSVNSILQHEPPDPQINIIIHPPEYAVIPKTVPLILSCVANFSQPFMIDNREADDDIEIDEEFLKNIPNKQTGKNHANFELMRRTHFTDLIADGDFNTKVNDNESGGGGAGGGGGGGDNNDFDNANKIRIPRKVREIGHIEEIIEYKLRYYWLKNDRPILRPSAHGINVLADGSLKFFPSSKASGIYRCVADGKHLGIGAVLSKPCNVQQPVFLRMPSVTNLTADIDSSIVIKCSFYSIPSADITWYINKTKINFANKNRYFQLNNGSLLIVNVQNSDSKKFSCRAQNDYTLKPLRTYTVLLSVVQNERNEHEKAVLMPPLQNQTMLVRTGETLRLLCAAGMSNAIIKWEYISLSTLKRNDLNGFNMELIINNVTNDLHSGIYQCSMGNDKQTYNVSVISSPVFVQTFSSAIYALGRYVRIKCSATGTPQPTVKWYKNGKLIELGYNIDYEDSSLIINTFEENHMGIYQCIAANEAGEIHLTKLLSMKQKQYIQRPKKVKCYPVNYSTLLITYETEPMDLLFHKIVYYTAVRNGNDRWLSDHIESKDAMLNKTFLIKKINRKPFEVFILFLRGLEESGHILKSGSKSMQYEMSRLSKGIKCGFQGLEINPIFRPNSIFIWWPKIKNINVKKFIIQFWHNDTSYPTIFADNIIGTYTNLDESHSMNNIEDILVKIPAFQNNTLQQLQQNNELFQQHKNRNVDNLNGMQSQSIRTATTETTTTTTTTTSTTTTTTAAANTTTTTSDNEINNGTITELHVDGNVTGILIPNTKKIIVRIFVPIIDDNGEEFQQDLSFVEWNTFTNDKNKYAHVIETGARSVILQSQIQIDCLYVCHKKTCDTFEAQSSNFLIKSLTPNTQYTMKLYSCDPPKNYYGDIHFTTNKYDIPGPITNHRIRKSNEIINIDWEPPIYLNGAVKYLLKLNIDNETHISYASMDTINYSLRNIKTATIFNLSIRAIGEGDSEGIPIYMNFKNLDKSPFSSEDDTENEIIYTGKNDYDSANKYSYTDPELGIAIGVLISMLIIFGTLYVVVCRRQKNQRPQINAVNLNNNNNNNNNNNVQPMPIAPSTRTMMDFHEMQTLLANPITTTVPPTRTVSGVTHTTIPFNDIHCVPNGNVFGNGTNVNHNVKIMNNISNNITNNSNNVDDVNGDASENFDTTAISIITNEYDHNPKIIYSSTPEPSRKCIPNNIINNDLNDKEIDCAIDDLEAETPLLIDNNIINQQNKVTDGAAIPHHNHQLNKYNNTNDRFQNNINNHQNHSLTNGKIQLLKNGSIHKPLPQNIQQHSEEQLKSTAKQNDNLRIIENPQFINTNSNNNHHDSSFNNDNSHEKLLDTTLDSNNHHHHNDISMELHQNQNHTLNEHNNINDNDNNDNNEQQQQQQQQQQQPLSQLISKFHFMNLVEIGVYTNTRFVQHTHHR